jgi:hypothetical protein
MTLAFSLSGVSALASLMAGVEFDDRLTNFPIFLSESPSNFWGRRWNNLIHVGLKEGVYKPVGWNSGNRILASVTAFCVSGLSHDFLQQQLRHAKQWTMDVAQVAIAIPGLASS